MVYACSVTVRRVVTVTTNVAAVVVPVTTALMPVRVAGEVLAHPAMLEATATESPVWKSCAVTGREWQMSGEARKSHALADIASNELFNTGTWVADRVMDVNPNAARKETREKVCRRSRPCLSSVTYRPQ